MYFCISFSYLRWISNHEWKWKLHVAWTINHIIYLSNQNIDGFSSLPLCHLLKSTKNQKYSKHNLGLGCQFCVLCPLCTLGEVNKGGYLRYNINCGYNAFQMTSNSEHSYYVGLMFSSFFYDIPSCPTLGLPSKSQKNRNSYYFSWVLNTLFDFWLIHIFLFENDFWLIYYNIFFLTFIQTTCTS